MANRELYDDTLPAVSIANAAHTANVTGTAVDLRGYRSALIEVFTGTMTDGTHTISLEAADDDGTGNPGTWSAVSASDATLVKGAVPAIAATDDNKVFDFAYLGNHDYIRVNVTVTGATTGGIYGALVRRGHPRHASTRATQI